MDETTNNLNFPDYFPEGCPPSEAKFMEIGVYRFCANSTPCEEDFKSFYLSNPEKYNGKTQSYGISVFPSLEACAKARNKCPSLMKNYKYCSNGITYKYTGKILETPSNNNPKHITWWLFDGVKPHTYFVTCGEKAEVSDE